MAITYKIDREKTLIYETWSGDIDTADLATYWKQYVADPEVMEIRRTIVDLRAAVIKLRGADFDGLIRTIVLPALKDRKWRTAIVTGGPLQFGVSRQYQVFAEYYSKDSLFDSITEAEKWIESSDL